MSILAAAPVQPYAVVHRDDEVFEICEFLMGESLLALDTETYSNGKPCPPALVAKGKAFTDPYSNNIRLVQVRSRESEAFIFDLMYMSEDGKAVLCNLLGQDHITWIGHNLKFDYKMIKVNLGVELKHVYDTQLAATCIGFATGDRAMKARGLRLKDVVRDYLDHYMDKTEQVSNWGARVLAESQLQYAADDLLHLFHLHDTLDGAVCGEYKMPGGVKLEMDVLPVVCEMELNGIDFDVEMYKIVQEAAKAYLPALEEKLCKYIGWDMIACPPLVRLKTGRVFMPKPTNFDGKAGSPLDSNAVMLKAFQKKGIPIENVQGEHMEEVAKATDSKILMEFIQYKDLTKQLSINYVDWIHPQTGRVHPSFNQSAASTARFGCNDPNIQQVPKMDIEVPETMYLKYKAKLEEFFDKKKGKCFVNYRYCFICSEDEDFYSADYSGQEVRVMVALSNDPNMVAIHWEPEFVEDPFQPGSGIMVANMAADIHAKTAELVWGRSHGVTCWTAKKMAFPGAPGKTFRDIAKTVTFGLAYGKTSVGLAQQLGITAEQADEIIAAYFAPYPVLKAWLERQGVIGNDTRMCLFGVPEVGITRWRMLNSDRHSDKGALNRAGKNTPIQGCSALMMKLALVRLQPLVMAAGGFLIGSVHDEVMVRASKRVRESVQKAIDQGMEEACAFFLRGIVPAKHGTGRSTHWSKD